MSEERNIFSEPPQDMLDTKPGKPVQVIDTIASPNTTLSNPLIGKTVDGKMIRAGAAALLLSAGVVGYTITHPKWVEGIGKTISDSIPTPTVGAVPETTPTMTPSP